MKDYHYVLNVTIEAKTEEEADKIFEKLKTPDGFHIEDVNVLKNHMPNMNKDELVELNFEADTMIARLMKEESVKLYAELLDVKRRIREAYNETC